MWQTLKADTIKYLKKEQQQKSWEAVVTGSEHSLSLHSLGSVPSTTRQLTTHLSWTFSSSPDHQASMAKYFYWLSQLVSLILFVKTLKPHQKMLRSDTVSKAIGQNYTQNSVMFYALVTNVKKKKLTTHFTTPSSDNKKLEINPRNVM